MYIQSAHLYLGNKVNLNTILALKSYPFEFNFILKNPANNNEDIVTRDFDIPIEDHPENIKERTIEILEGYIIPYLNTQNLFYKSEHDIYFKETKQKLIRIYYRAKSINEE